MAATLLIALPLVNFFAQSGGASNPTGQLPDENPLAGAPLFAQSKPVVLPRRVCRALGHQSDANGTGGRETVMKLLDVMVYILVYFTAVFIMVAKADYRLMLPMAAVWLMAYILAQLYFVPRLKRVATEQADARSTMTGRVVDSYTNIQTVKLFAHTDRETLYARESMDGFMKTVYRQMRLVTGLNMTVSLINYSLAFAIAATAIWLWSIHSISTGRLPLPLPWHCASTAWRSGLCGKSVACLRT